MKHIAIIGAGVIGTTAAIRLIDRFGDSVVVTIFSSEFSPYTTGDVSAGLWSPFLIGDTPKENVRKWSKDTHDYLLKLWKDGEATKAGISLIPVLRFTKDNEEIDTYWKDIVFGCTELDKNQIERLISQRNTNYTSGIHFVTFTCEPVKFLPYLYKKFISSGGRIQQKLIKSFDELSAFDLIINCAGIGAQVLAKNENDLRPIRGQVMRIKAPWIFEVMLVDCDDGNYIIPNADVVILGGTHQENDYNTHVNADDTKFIYDGCMKLLPSIKRAQIIKEMAGLRPGRSSVRLEHDTFTTKKGKTLQVIHNYGHGGCGVCLSWGCAKSVCDIAEELLKNQPNKSKL